jgi:iron complex outermembrane receptor protein
MRNHGVEFSSRLDEKRGKSTPVNWGTRMYIGVAGSIVQVIIVALLAFAASAHAQDQPIHSLEEIVVTASRIPITFSDIPRSTIVIARRDIQTAPVHSVQGLLEYALGVDERQRGPFGVQADVRVRGGTNEQTLNLEDGIRVSDPQTGHHNLDLPFALDDIERIEILKGHGSSLYGPNAFGGVINIITRKTRENAANLEVTVGDYRSSGVCMSLSYPLGTSGHHLSLSKKGSAGYRDNSDFDISTVSYSSSIQVGSGEVGLCLGYMDKEFGANGFYSESFPHQWEETKTSFLSARLRLEGDGLTFSPKLYWREHKDHFVLDRENPEWYQNRHTTRTQGIEFQSAIRSRIGVTAFGVEAGREEIESTNLGNHARTKGGIFFEHRLVLGEWLLLALGAFGSYSDWGWKIWPGIDLGFQLSDAIRPYGSVGHSFRVPTYTELYYSSPANKGSPGLRPEEAWTYEVGLNWRKGILAGNLAVFRREGRDLIDWVRAESIDPWEARNIARVNTNGLEISLRSDLGGLKGHFPVSAIHAGYAFLDSEKRTRNFESKYVLEHLKHQLIVGLEYDLPHQLKQNWKIRYEGRSGYDGHVLADTRISYRYTRVEFFVEATNLFDLTYVEAGWVPMPGRWVMAALKLNLW